ncbi:2'-5' RNA ligase family protein [Chitinophaga sp. CCNWLY40-1]|uniref:2'-5' RNA ligase family protein n=1 Tax=Chitinophaga sp. CCNWLY40-1 TaxID=3136720 RepID=UPI0030478016
MPRRHNPDQLTLFPLDTIPTTMVSYAVVISPPRNIVDHVKIMENKVYDFIPEAKHEQYLKAHISLLKFTSEEDDTRIIHLVRRAVAALPSFEVQLNGYDIFQHGYTSDSLVLQISNPQPIIELHKSLFKALKRKTPRITPHMTIVKEVPHHKLRKIDLSSFNYYDSFLCTQITILKKIPGAKRYDKLFEVLLSV